MERCPRGTEWNSGVEGHRRNGSAAQRSAMRPGGVPMVDVPVTDPTAIRLDLNPGLAAFLIKACAPASVDRFATAADMRLALRNVRADL